MSDNAESQSDIADAAPASPPSPRGGYIMQAWLVICLALVFGASLAEMSAITGHELAAAADDGLRLRGGVHAGECADLLKAWAARRRV